MKEDGIYILLAQYLNLQFNGVPYHFDLAGVWTPSHKARNLYGRLNHRAWPDLFIPVPRNGHNGLFLEIKKDGVKVYKKDGSIVANAHFQEQARVLDMLNALGYKAEFAVGFNQARDIIKEYLNGTAEERELESGSRTQGRSEEGAERLRKDDPGTKKRSRKTSRKYAVVEANSEPDEF